MALTRRTLLLAKTETTYGVDSLPVVATDAIPITSFSINPNITTISRDLFRDTLSPEVPIVGKRFMEIDFTAEVVGNGLQQDGTTEPNIIRLLEACSMLSVPTAETTTGAGDGLFTVTPSSGTQSSLTLYAYLDGSLYILLGSKGTVSLTADSNAVGKFSFKMTGLLSTPTDTAIPTMPVSSAILPPLIKNVNLTMGGAYAPILSALSIDLANNVVARDDINAVTGIGNIIVESRKPTGSINPDLMAVAQYDIWTNFLNSVVQPIDCQIGVTPGNICSISIPEAVYDSIGVGDRDGVRIYDVKFTPTGNDNEISFIFK